MVDTPRLRTELQALFADNNVGDISAQDLRDYLASTVLNTDDPLPIANGGTASSTASAALAALGAAAASHAHSAADITSGTLDTGRLGSGTANNTVVLLGNQTWAQVNSTQLADNSVSNSKIRDSVGCSVLGRSVNSTGDPADIDAASDGIFLGRRSSVLSFLTPRLNELQFRGAWAYHSTTQSVSNATWTAAALDSEYLDTDSYHSTVTNNSRLTAPATSRYFVIGQYALNTSVGTTWFRAALRSNGTSYLWQNDGYPAGNVALVNVCGIFALSSGDYVELAIYHVSGVSATASSAQMIMIPIGVA